MPQVKSKATKPNWATQLRGQLSVKVNEPVGKDWMTTRQIAEQMDRSISVATGHVKNALELGNLESFKGSTIMNGFLRHQMWYRPVKK